MKNKKYQVFISSTFEDLIEERKIALDVLLKADCIPAGMEAFVATDAEQFEVIKKVIDLCDYYILIIGKKYGSVNTKLGISYTEMEYDYAKSKDIPVLVFAIGDSVILPENKVEKDKAKIEGLKKFKEKAMSNRLASIWNTHTDLTGAIAISIMNAKTEIPRQGWQRAADYDEAALLREIVELKKKNEDLENDLGEANNTISTFTKQTDIAFDDCIIEIPYYYHVSNGGYNSQRHDKILKIELTKIFVIIATEMMDVIITENSVETAILNSFLSRSRYIGDDQLIKRILNQLKALNLVYSKWVKGKPLLYWGLTAKGRKIRDDMILIRNTD